MDNIEELLDAILRGAAKILGCTATNLLLIDEKTRDIRIRVGAMATSYPVLDAIEGVLGETFSGFVMPIDHAADSLVIQSWRDRTTRETSSLRELVGSAFSPEVVGAVQRIVGDQRFICVPARTTSVNYGVLLFAREGDHPFSGAQRETLLRYARSIGELIENDLMRQGQSLFSLPSVPGPQLVILDREGNWFGQGRVDPATAALLAAPAVHAQLAEPLRALCAGSDDAPSRRLEVVSGDGAARLVLSRLDLDGEPRVLCAVHRAAPRATSAEWQEHLLRLTLGDPAPALFVDRDLTVTSCNDVTEKQFGYAADELCGQSVGRLFRQRRAILDLLGQQVLDPSNPYCEEEATLVRKDGTLAPARVKALVLADDRDLVVGFLVLVKLEEERSDASMPIDRLATMGEMAAQLAHEIRNPLVAIAATLDGVRQGDLDDEQRAAIDSSIREIDRLDLALKDFMGGRHDLSLSDVSVAVVAEDARGLLEGARRTTRPAIDVMIDPTLRVRADHDALKHVLFNLMHNALEASPAAGKVVCRADADANAGEIAIFVEDEGPGLAANAAQCFRPFFTTKRNGSGLGLSVCQKLVRAHGGVVELRDRANGSGCQAVVLLPQRRPRGR